MWALFILFYNIEQVLSVKYVYTKITAIGLIGLGLLIFVSFSRLSLVGLATMEDLDASGRQRIVDELVAFEYMLDQHQIEGLLFGLQDREAETIRSAAGLSDKVTGNALIEIVLRYGVVVPFLLLVQFCAAAGFTGGLILFGIFALLGQIDGSVAKPLLWLYVGLAGVSLAHRPGQRVQAAAAPA